MHRHTADTDLFADLRVDEQLTKALDRKVFLPSGGSLVIDRTEAMTVIDVNTGKFIGSGGNLEQTVTRNNIEAAEEIVRQLRLRDVGGIVVIDFIDMVLESNRDLVLRRLTECLGRDRTKHQVAEVTSLGLVQMTRKRVGEGLLEAFSETCEVCHGRGVIVHTEPVDQQRFQRRLDGPTARPATMPARQGKRRRGGRGNGEPAELSRGGPQEQRRAANAAIAAIHRATNGEDAGRRGRRRGRRGCRRRRRRVRRTAPSRAVPDAVRGGGSHRTPESPAEPPAAAVQLLHDAVQSVATLELGTAPAPNEVHPSHVDDTTEQVELDAAEPIAPAPVRRRRRAASRPAGPPTTS